MYPRFFSPEEGWDMENKVELEEIKEVLSNIMKDKILGPDDWTIEFFFNFFDIVGKDLLRAIEEFREKNLSW